MADEEHAAARVGKLGYSRRSMKRSNKDEEEVAEDRGSKKSRSSGSDDEEGPSAPIAPTTLQEKPSTQSSLPDFRKDSVKVEYITKKNEKEGFFVTVKVEGIDNRSAGHIRPAQEFSEFHRRMTKFRFKGIYVPKLPTTTTKMSGQEQCDAMTRYMNHLVRNDEVRGDREVYNFLITPLAFDAPQETSEEAAIKKKAESSKFAYQVRDLYGKFELAETATTPEVNRNLTKDAFGRTLLDHELMLRSFFKNRRGLSAAFRDNNEVIEKFGRDFVHYAKREHETPLLGEQHGEFRSEELEKALQQYFQDMTDARTIHNYQANSTINTHVERLHYTYVTLFGERRKDEDYLAKVKENVQKTRQLNAEFDKTIANEIKEISVARFNDFLSSVFKYGREKLQLTKEQVLEVFSASDSKESAVASPVVDAPGAAGSLPQAPKPVPSGSPAPAALETDELAKRLGQAKIPKQ